MPAITSRTSNSAVVNDSIPLPKTFPALPEKVKTRFPDMEDWEQRTAKWWSSAFTAITEFNRDGVTIINQNYDAAKALRVSVNGLTAEIEEINEVIVTNNEAFARRLVTVSAMAGLATNITVQGTPPGGPALNDYWLDNSDPVTPITYQWDGADWVEVTTPITAAAVAQEASARATADGNLEGKYTLTVTAGDVVTGMNITSASGPGTNISSVIFRATDFKIYNSVTGVEMFTVSGTAIKLGATLTVDTVNSKVYIGTGTFNNTNTAFYVDSTGQFSLKDKLSWDGAALTVSGTVNAGAGFFGTGSSVVQIDSDGLVVGVDGTIRGGQTAYDTGTGFWFGYDSFASVYKFSIGNPGVGGAYLRFSGFNVEASQVVIHRDLLVSDGSYGVVVNADSVTGPLITLIAPGDDMEITGSAIKIGGSQIIGPRLSSVADATGAGDVVAQLNTLLARIRTHGLIAT